MANTNIKTKQGFTIIEVVLVLAIAGLIFLMVFIAWPALQRSQRDTQRRNDYAMLSTAVSNFIANNNGKLSNLPGTPDPKKFINEDGTDPDGVNYVISVYEQSELEDNAPTNKGEVFIVTGANCNGDGGTPAADTSTRAFAIYGFLEGGSGTFCTDSQ